MNSDGHVTIKKKMEKQLNWIYQLTPKTKLKILVENLQLLTEKVICNTLDICKIIKETLDEFNT